MRTKFLLVIGAFIVIAAGLLLFSGGRRDDTEPAAKLSPLAPKNAISPRQKVTIGKTKAKEIEKELPIIDKEEKGEEVRVITGAAELARPEEVVLQNDVAIFERLRPSDDPASTDYLTLAQVKDKFGEPEEMIVGSAFYGPFVAYYIYAKQGYTFLGHNYNGEIYEVQVYKPTSVASYKRLYGQDIQDVTTVPDHY